LGPVTGSDSAEQLSLIQSTLRNNGLPEGQRLP